MECFNCGNDSDMEVFMMVNGKMKKINICMACYQEQMQNMMESMTDANGELNPEEIQKKMFNFFQDHREEFEQFLGEAVDDENFDISKLNSENFDIKDMNFENSGFDLSKDMNEIFSKLSNNVNKELFNFKNGKKELNNEEDINPKYTKYDPKISNSSKSREIKNLQKAVSKKRIELNQQVAKEDYLAAAASRDEMRELNKKIMIIKRLVKEGK